MHGLNCTCKWIWTNTWIKKWCYMTLEAWLFCVFGPHIVLPLNRLLIFAELLISVVGSSSSRQGVLTGASSEGVIPKARIKTIKMTLVIVIGKCNHMLSPFIGLHWARHLHVWSNSNRIGYSCKILRLSKWLRVGTQFRRHNWMVLKQFQLILSFNTYND